MSRVKDATERFLLYPLHSTLSPPDTVAFRKTSAVLNFLVIARHNEQYPLLHGDASQGTANNIRFSMASHSDIRQGYLKRRSERSFFRPLAFYTQSKHDYFGVADKYGRSNIISPFPCGKTRIFIAATR